MAKTGKGLPRSLENTDFSSVVPGATVETAGLVKKGAAVSNIGTQTVTGAEAAAVATSAQTAVNAVGTKLNALLAQLRAAGVIES